MKKDGILSINNDFPNHFQYKENINAAYINYRLEKKKIGIQAGLRYENTNINGYQLGNSIRKDSSFIRKYNSFFPTFYASYKLDSADNVGTHWYIGPTNQFQINDKWSAELSGNYQTKVYCAQFVLIPVGSIRAGVGKKK